MCLCAELGMTFAEVLARTNGSLCKARREYIRLRRWRNEEWYAEWGRGLAAEVEEAARIRATDSD
jgi:hypothetical protein